MAVNFRVVPLVHRAAVGGAFGALWNVYLCGQANKDDPETQQPHGLSAEDGGESGPSVSEQAAAG